jgi:hypothetical protein
VRPHTSGVIGAFGFDTIKRDETPQAASLLKPGYLGVAHAGFEVQAIDRRNSVLDGVELGGPADRRAMLSGRETDRRQR